MGLRQANLPRSILNRLSCPKIEKPGGYPGFQFNRAASDGEFLYDSGRPGASTLI